jgi:hypothetical protein
MRLEYLLFDSSDEETGSCSFDAMASALPARIRSLIHEVEAVLGWAYDNFGAPSAAEDGGEWDFALQATGERDGPLEITYDPIRARASLPQANSRVTLTLTVTGSRTFAQAFRSAFPDSD